MLNALARGTIGSGV